jgi:hypothetical protein
MKGVSGKKEYYSKSTNEKVGKTVNNNKKINHDILTKTLSGEEMREYDSEVWSRLPLWVREMLTMIDEG